MLGVLVILSFCLSLRLSNEIPYSHLYVLQHRESKLIYKKTFFLNVLSLYLSLSLHVSLSLSSQGRHWIVRVVSFRNLYYMWVCEASEVNISTVFAVGPNGAKIAEVMR